MCDNHSLYNFIQSHCFHEALYYKSFFLVCFSSYTLSNVKCILLVYLYYIAKYIVFNYFISSYLGGICDQYSSLGLR